MNKRFLVFAYDMYYPVGGMRDLCASYNTFEEAKASVQKELQHKEYVQIYDRVEGILVCSFEAL